MARRLISLPEAAGTPEGGKVLARGSAPMDAVLSIGPCDAEQLPVSLFLKFTGVLCRCTQHSGRAFCPTLLQLRAATRAVTRERKTSEGAL